MNKESYNINSPNETIFTFISKGSLGEINKAVVFQEIEENVYNLVLLDYDSITDKWSDDNVSNNGDMTKVLSTVTYIINTFLESKPNAQIYIEANSTSRNKLYNRIFKNYFKDFETKIELKGFKNDEIKDYNYSEKFERFYLKLKS